MGKQPVFLEELETREQEAKARRSGLQKEREQCAAAEQGYQKALTAIRERLEKKEKLAQFHRQNIMETAENLFAEKRIAQTTMDDIAKNADYSKSTIYVYFKSKEEIIYNEISDRRVRIWMNIMN